MYNPARGPGDERYFHDVNATSPWQSSHQILTPYLYHSLGTPILMFNLHSIEMFGRPIDDVMQCAAERKAVANGTQECSVLTDMLVLTGQDPSARLAARPLSFIPYIPQKIHSTWSGVISSTIVWDQALVNVFSDKVNGVDVVLQTESQVFTYEIVQGVPTLK